MSALVGGIRGVRQPSTRLDNPVNLPRSRVALTLSLILAACSGLPSVDPMPPAPRIEVLRILPGPGSGCTLQFRMTNTYEFTMSIMGTASLIDAGENIIGATFVRFPPALPGKTSEAGGMYYDYQLASKSCGPMVKAKFKAAVCENVTTAEYFNDALCQRIEITNNAN